MTTPQLSDILASLNSIQNEKLQLVSNLQAEESQIKAMQKMLAVSLEYNQQLSNLSKKGMEKCASNESTLEKNQAKMKFTKEKIQFYQEDIEQNQAKLHMNGYDESLTHTQLCSRWHELQAKLKQVSELKKSLSFYCLPPDVALATQTFQREKNQLSNLMESTVQQLSKS